MAFSDETVKKAWDRAGGKCECERTRHNHPTPHNKTLRWESRGSSGPLGWQAHHGISVDSGGTDTLSNCEILCWDCHKATF